MQNSQQSSESNKKSPRKKYKRLKKSKPEAEIEGLDEMMSVDVDKILDGAETLVSSAEEALDDLLKREDGKLYFIACHVRCFNRMFW